MPCYLRLSTIGPTFSFPEPLYMVLTCLRDVPFEWLVQAIHGLESMYPFTVEASWNRTGSYAQSVIGTVLFL